MNGKDLTPDYRPTRFMKASEIIWNPISQPSETIKINVWDVVDKAIESNPDVKRTKKLPDASNVDTLSHADGVIVLYDPRNEETIKYAQSIIDQVPQSTPLIILSNFCDTIDNPHFIHPLMETYAEKYFHLSTSMNRNIGLQEIATWLDLPMYISLRKIYSLHLDEESKRLKELLTQFNQYDFTEPPTTKSDSPSNEKPPTTINGLPTIDTEDVDNDFWGNTTETNEHLSNFFGNEDETKAKTQEQTIFVPTIGDNTVDDDNFFDDDSDSENEEKDLEKFMKLHPIPKLDFTTIDATNNIKVNNNKEEVAEKEKEKEEEKEVKIRQQNTGKKYKVLSAPKIQKPIIKEAPKPAQIEKKNNNEETEQVKDNTAEVSQTLDNIQAQEKSIASIQLNDDEVNDDFFDDEEKPNTTKLQNVTIPQINETKVSDDYFDDEEKPSTTKLMIPQIDEGKVDDDFFNDDKEEPKDINSANALQQTQTVIPQIDDAKVSDDFFNDDEEKQNANKSIIPQKEYHSNDNLLSEEKPSATSPIIPQIDEGKVDDDFFNDDKEPKDINSANALQQAQTVIHQIDDAKVSDDFFNDDKEKQNASKSIIPQINDAKVSDDFFNDEEKPNTAKPIIPQIDEGKVDDDFFNDDKEPKDINNANALQQTQTVIPQIGDGKVDDDFFNDDNKEIINSAAPKQNTSETKTEKEDTKLEDDFFNDNETKEQQNTKIDDFFNNITSSNNGSNSHFFSDGDDDQSIPTIKELKFAPLEPSLKPFTSQTPSIKPSTPNDFSMSYSLNNSMPSENANTTENISPSYSNLGYESFPSHQGYESFGGYETIEDQPKSRPKKSHHSHRTRKSKRQTKNQKNSDPNQTPEGTETDFHE
ncbi:rab-like protein 6 [Histomonas meleagridis]|uniref:rab-like protein 6 n=1 Tax=Histomonas meleagridis TaxID=135588 RepID=UPI003559A2F2|nr:rab-like protein 6 [Histomonas meleagridis]KAH0798035.1 rab-like protein 6 [Histomonas meleagridis]